MRFCSELTWKRGLSRVKWYRRDVEGDWEWFYTRYRKRLIQLEGNPKLLTQQTTRVSIRAELV